MKPKFSTMLDACGLRETRGDMTAVKYPIEALCSSDLPKIVTRVHINHGTHPKITIEGTVGEIAAAICAYQRETGLSVSFVGDETATLLFLS